MAGATPPESAATATAPPPAHAPGQASANGHPPEPEKRSYASGARVLTIGIASTGIFTFLYLATASHVLDPASYSRISLCWAIMFVILSVIYRPVEQLLSRTIADRRARGLHGHPLRIPAMIQFGFAILFLIVALTMRSEIEQGIFDGSSALYWILVIGVLAYSASYFARGWLAGHERFALYGGLVFLEATSRYVFALIVAVGIASGQGAVGLGMAVAPFASLAVIPFAFSRLRVKGAEGVPAFDAAAEGPAHAEIEEAAADLSMKHGAGFAASVVGIMLAEQTLMNAGVLIVAAKAGELRRPHRRHHGLRVQRDADRARAAPAVPGHPDLDPPPPGRSRGPRERRGVPPRDSHDREGDRGVRRRGGAWVAHDRTAGDDRAAG